MRLALWLPLAGLLAPIVANAQQDTAFKDVEYLTGIDTLAEKHKGTLLVTRQDIRLVDKKRQPYLVIPLARIQEVADTAAEKGATGKVVSSVVKNSPLKGLFGGPDQQLFITLTRDSAADASDSTAEQVVTFKIHKREMAPAIVASIQRAMNPSQEDGEPAQPAMMPLMLVANPFTDVADDSAAAVKIGTALRADVAKFAGTKFLILTREQMNAVLAQYGYPADAILSPALTTTLAKQLQAAVLLSSTMSKADDGRYTVQASLAAVGGEPGAPVTVVQEKNESPDALGRRVAEALKGPQATPENPAPEE